MKLIKRKANLIIAVICAINVPVCVFVALRQNEARFAVTAAASVLLAFSNLYYALAPRSSAACEDERDVFSSISAIKQTLLFFRLKKSGVYYAPYMDYKRNGPCHNKRVQ